MRLNRFVKACAVAAAAIVAGCSDALIVSSSELAGTWDRPAQQMSPQGSYELRLTFTHDGKFVTDGRMYGLYAGQAAGELSGYTKVEGQYSIDGDRLVMVTQRIRTWDRFYGASSPERVEEPYITDQYLDDARFELDGSNLTIHYTTYPADAPVPTTMRLRRAGN